MDNASSSFGDLPVLPVEELYPPEDFPMILDMVDDLDDEEWLVDDDLDDECEFWS